MKAREVILTADEVMADSFTKTLALDIDSLITGLYVQFRATNGATSNIASPLHRCISKIEIVDGGETIWSMPGAQQVGWNAGLTGVRPHGKISEIASDSQYSNIPILFGRHLYDEAYAFNPAAFRNPQIKVTANLASVNAVGATGFVTGTGYLTVQAHCMDDVSAPNAMLVKREYENFTSAASGDHKVELNTDRIWRSLLVRAYEAGVAMNSTVTNLKLNFGGGKYIPFDQSLPKFWRKAITELGSVESLVLAQCDNAGTPENYMAHVIGGNVNGRSTDMIVTANNHDNGQSTVYIVNDAGTAQSAEGVWIAVRGTGLENCLVVPFGSLNEPSQWLNPQGMGKGFLYITQGNAGANISVSVEEVYTY